MALLPNNQLISGSDDKTVIIWDTLSGSLKSQMNAVDSVISLLVLGDGNVLVGTSDNSLNVYNIKDGTKKLSLVKYLKPYVLLGLTNGNIMSSSNNALSYWRYDF